MTPTPGRASAFPGASPEAVPRLKTMAKKERFEIRVDDKFMEALTDLAERTGKNRADVIRDALNYYENALNEWEKEHAKIHSRPKVNLATEIHHSPVPA